MQEQVDNIIDVSEATFDQEVLARSYEIPVVVDFWAAWCGPCRMLGPLLEKLAAEPGSNFILAKLDVDDNPSISQEYNVRGIPAVKGFRDGGVVAEFVGAQPEGQVRQFLRQVAPSDSDRLLSQARAHYLRREWAPAEKAYHKVLANFPGQPEAQIGMVRSLLMQGNRKRFPSRKTLPGRANLQTNSPHGAGD